MRRLFLDFDGVLNNQFYSLLSPNPHDIRTNRLGWMHDEISPYHTLLEVYCYET